MRAIERLAHGSGRARCAVGARGVRRGGAPSLRVVVVKKILSPARRVAIVAGAKLRRAILCLATVAGDARALRGARQGRGEDARSLLRHDTNRSGTESDRPGDPEWPPGDPLLGRVSC